MKRHGPRIPRSPHRNPKAGIPVLPLVLIAGGAYLLLRKREEAPAVAIEPTPVEPGPTAVSGLGFSFSSVTGAVRNAFSNAAGTVRQVVRRVSAPVGTAIKAGVAQAISAPAQVFSAALPVASLTPTGAALLAVGAQLAQRKEEEPAPEAAPVQQYQDENGNPITEAQFMERMTRYLTPKGEQISKEDFNTVLAKAGGSAVKGTYTYEGGTYDTYTLPDTIAVMMALNPQEIAAPPSPVYKDADGKVITKEQYDQLLAQIRAQGVTTPPTTEVIEIGGKGAPGRIALKLPKLPPTTSTNSGGIIPQPQVLYFDANGKQITSLQFSQAMNAIPGANPERVKTANGWAYKVPSAAPATTTSVAATTPTAVTAPTVNAPATGQANQVTYQTPGGSQESDYTLPPAYTPPTAQAAPQYAPAGEAAAAAAPAKVNPAVAVGAFLAVPLVFMMSGGK